MTYLISENLILIQSKFVCAKKDVVSLFVSSFHYSNFQHRSQGGDLFQNFIIFQLAFLRLDIHRLWLRPSFVQFNKHCKPVGHRLCFEII